MSFFLKKKKKKNCQTKIDPLRVFKCVFDFCFVLLLVFFRLGKNMVPKPSSQVAQTKAGESNLICLCTNRFDT